ncbi:MAG TPA: gamma-type small acid-soluble spore protein [Bacillales bacterium]|nr:gamma-type small acid-soluble spore protein [Bacillales bacterium]
MAQDEKRFTVAGTDIEEVKKKNADSGMSYNEAKEWLALTTGGRGTNIYSDTDVEEVKRQNNLSQQRTGK